MSLLSDYPVVIEQEVAWGDMDSYRHVNNVVYFRYFENARLEYFRKLDWFNFEKETGVGPILASTQARFRKPLTYPDTIEIAVRVSDIAADRFTMQYAIASQQLGAIAAEGTGLIVTFHYESQVKVPIPAELLSRIKSLEDSRSG